MTSGKEGQTKTETEAAITCLPAKECQELLATVRSEERQEQILTASKSNQHSQHLDFRRLASRGAR